jgi:phosphoribosylamine-glycine ligase
MFIRKFDRDTRPIGRGLVELVPDWRGCMDWSDLVILEGNGVYMADMAVWKGRGCNIIGGTPESAAWELDRKKGMEVFRKAGIPIPEFREFNDYAAAIGYVEKRGEVFYSKPCSDTADKSLSAKTGIPEDPAWMLRKWKKKHGRPPCPFLLQEGIDGVEFAVGAWFGPAGFADGWEENFEHKRFCAGDVGPNCYSADTEVLTETGWKFWPDVTTADRLATRVDGFLTFERPSQLVAEPFRGDMIAWQSNRLDLLVTPGHRMYVGRRSKQRKGDNSFEFISAAEIAESQLGKEYAVTRTAAWTGNGGPMPAEARMLGMFLADGYCSERAIRFGNCPPHKEALIRDAALCLGLPAPRYGPDVYINSRELADSYRHYPGSTERRVPPEIMNAPPATVAAFLDGLSLDATTRKGNLTYSTVCRGLADDIQILAAKAGLCGILRVRDRRDEPDRMLKGYLIRGALSYEVGISSQSLAWLRPQFCRRVPYEGMVYCATVSSHVLFVRRNGKPCWNGQTGEMGTVERYTRRSKLADQVLKPLEAQLDRIGYIGNVDVNCIVDNSGSAWPLEFTMRLGWPAFNIETDLFEADPIEFLHAVCIGESVRGAHHMDRVAVGVVLALPPYPNSPRDYSEILGVPLYGCSDGWHPCEIMADDGEADFASGGHYLGISVGTGESVREAARGAYKAARAISTPQSLIYRTDIGARLKKELPILQATGYAVGMEY